MPSLRLNKHQIYLNFIRLTKQYFAMFVDYSDNMKILYSGEIHDEIKLIVREISKDKNERLDKLIINNTTEILR